MINFLSNDSVFILVIIYLSIVLGIVFGIGAIIYYRYKSFVLEHSIALKRLDELNNKYLFKPVKEYNINRDFDNEIYYKKINCIDLLIYNLVFLKNEVKQNISYCIENMNLKAFYINDVNQIKNFGIYNATELKSHKLLVSIEEKLFKSRIKNPITYLKMNITVTLININGNEYERKVQTFYQEDIEALIDRINNKTGDRYNDQGIWDSICRVERGKVSNKMRFAIYQRDGYRCRKCGRKTDDLEIDHIMPIAKGGKTEFNNLQTLCKRCNSEKSDFIEGGTFETSNRYKRYCSECGAPLRIINGKNGKFYGCMNYPKCKHTEKIYDNK